MSKRNRDESGAVLLIVAAFMAVVLAAAGLAVDVGRITHRKRELQSLVDLVAIDAARVIADGVPTSEIYDDVEAEARASAARNGFLADEVAAMTVTLGKWTDATRTFTAYDPDDPVTGLLVPDAVKVVADSLVDFLFGAGESQPSRTATAIHRFAGTPTVIPVPTTLPPTTVPGSPTTSAPPPPPVPSAAAGLTIGSFLAEGEPDPELLNRLLGAYLRLPPLHITAVGYQGLATGTVTLDELRAALELGTVDELLHSEIAIGDIVQAMATVLDNRGELAAAEALGFGDASIGAPSVKLLDLFSIQAGQEGAAAIARLHALDLLMGVAMLANKAHLLTVDLSGVVDGVANARLELYVIEAPVTAFGGIGTIAETAQVRASITATAGGVTVPVVVSGAGATGEVTRLACPAGGPDGSSYAFDTQAFSATVGRPVDLTAGDEVLPVPFLGTPVEVDGVYEDVDFSWPHGMFDSQPYTVGSVVDTAYVAGLLLDTAPVTGSLLGDPDIAPAVEAIGTDLDRILTGLGLRIAGADVTTYAPVCSMVALAP